MGVTPIQPVQVLVPEPSSLSKSQAKSRRIFTPTNNLNKTRTIPGTHLQYSQINSLQEYHTERPSQSLVNMFSSRLMHSHSSVKVNLLFFQSLSLPSYQSANPGEQERGTEEVRDVGYRGTIYSGSMKDSKPHGKGKLFTDYQYYQGWFKNGVKHPHGRQISSNQVYEGEFYEGRRKGKGVLYTKGKVYKGFFHEIFVKGVIEYKDGSVYEGEVDEKENKIKSGVLRWKNGAKYEGEFKGNMFHGSGRMTDVDGSVFEGEFVNGLRNGKGKYTIQKSDQKYQGEYMNNKKHGKGKLWLSVTKNHYYEGEFKDGKPHNNGVLRNQLGEKAVVHSNGILKQIS